MKLLQRMSFNFNENPEKMKKQNKVKKKRISRKEG